MPATTRRLLWFFGIAGSSALGAGAVSMFLRWLLLH
jgi:cellobiose-specific phosphotransferase system component IIC